MPKDDNHDAGPSALPGSPSDSDHDTSSGAFPSSAKLRAKLSKLADQRLDLSSIEFVNGAPEFQGGFATVSRAFLVPPLSAQDRASQSNPTKKQGLDSPGPAGEASRQRKDVAVKKMNVSDDSARVLGLALREAEFLVGLSHENVIRLEGFVEDLSKEVVWLVFLWAENGNLKNFIASAEWEIPERVCLIYDVACGVEYLHSRQPPIRHGDLKSINILINSEYRAVITDFGSARRQATEDLLGEGTSHAEHKFKPPPALSLEPAFCGATNTMTLTLKGDLFTLRWAAPELLYKKKATLASDIWAFGCVVYEVMTNSIPFHDVEVDTAVIIRVVTGKLPSITNNARMALIKALCSLALACWTEDPRKRPTAEDCRKSISFLPMARPNPIWIGDASASRARSPVLLRQLGVMYRQQGDYVNALDFLTEALDLHLFRGDYSQGLTFYSEALQIRTDIGDREGRAEALWGLAEVHRLRSEYNQATTFYTKALQISTDIGNKQGRANVLWGLAEMHRVRNENNQAMTLYSEVLQIRTDFGDRHGRASTLWGLADMHRFRREDSQAITFYTESLQIFTDIGDKKGRADALWCLADLLRDRNEYNRAVTLYTEALRIRTDIGDRSGRASALKGLAHVHRLRKEYSEAIPLYSEALNIQASIGDRYGRARSLMGLADMHRYQGNYNEAICPYTEAAEVFEKIGNTQDAAYASTQAAKVSRLSMREGST